MSIVGRSRVGGPIPFLAGYKLRDGKWVFDLTEMSCVFLLVRMLSVDGAWTFVSRRLFPSCLLGNLGSVRGLASD
jgi:hypothetical protein